MKPNREAIESIVKSLDTGTLISMLASKGIYMGEPQEDSPVWSSEDDKNDQAWNNIKIELDKREPSAPLHSSETYLKPKMEEKPEYMASENPPMLEPWMQSGVQG